MLDRTKQIWLPEHDDEEDDQQSVGENQADMVT